MGHWRHAHAAAKREREAAYLSILAMLNAKRMTSYVDAPEGMHVTITRMAPGTLDDDNLTGSGKHVRDGIAHALRIDDRDSRVTWVVEPERTARGEYGVRVDFRKRTPEEHAEALRRAAKAAKKPSPKTPARTAKQA